MEKRKRERSLSDNEKGTNTLKGGREYGRRGKRKKGTRGERNNNIKKKKREKGKIQREETGTEKEKMLRSKERNWKK